MITLVSVTTSTDEGVIKRQLFASLDERENFNFTFEEGIDVDYVFPSELIWNNNVITMGCMYDYH
jgi:hypothetical protein